MSTTANPAKAAGTKWERDISVYLRAHHSPEVLRTGHLGPVDVSGYYLHAVEAKTEKMITLSAYLTQANRAAAIQRQPFGVAVVKRRGANVSTAYVVRDLATDVRLVNRLRDAEQLLQGHAPADVWKSHYERHGAGH